MQHGDAMQTNKIVIVGGGSAGWMTAATLRKGLPHKSIKLIESKNVPLVGVGESTLGHINRWRKFVGIEDKDFMPRTNASYKHSIKFSGWSDKPFHYPFGSAQYENFDPFYDWHSVKYFYDLPADDYVDTFFSAALAFKEGKYVEQSPGMNSDLSVAYHFDAIAFGQYLKENHCEGVEHIVADVTGARTDEDGYIKALVTSEGEIEGDLFIDCTGFKSLLLGEFMREPFIDYSDKLPNNKAWACAVPYVDKEKELEPFTNCTAIGNGWCWNIPLWSRLGTGYVYSDKYVSDEEALQEFKNYLMSDAMVVPRTNLEVDELEFRPIQMRTGIHERGFVKNVVGIGLALGFLEPLESNGLLTVHETLFYLLDVLQKDWVTDFDKQMFNEETFRFFDQFARFLFLHYAMTSRSDTPYWRDCAKRTWPGIEFTEKFMRDWSHFPNRGEAMIATGMGYNFVNEWRAQFTTTLNGNGKEAAAHNKAVFDKMKEQWQEIADKSPMLYDYLEEHIYGIMDS